MAWWPFGKKKGSEASEEGAPGGPQTPEAVDAAGDAAPTIPPQQDLVPAPTMLVPPEFAPGGADAATLGPGMIMGGQPGGAPGGPRGFGGGPDPFGNDPGDPFAAPAPGDPFAAPQASEDFARTLEDPDSPKVKKRPPPARPGPAPAPATADPFAAPARRNDFAQTLSDPDEGRTLAPAYAQSPGGPGRQPAPASDLFASAEPHEQTIKMPGPPQLLAPQNPSAAPAASEETPMLAKTAALSPEKRRLGRALLAGGPITQERLLEELEKSGKSQSVLGKALLKSNFPKEEELLAALVASIRIPKINVRNTKIPLETIKVVPGEVAKRWKVLPIEKIGDILVIVSPGVGEEEALSAVRKATGCSVFPFQCDAEGFEDVLDGYYDRLAASGIGVALSPVSDPTPYSPPPTPRPVNAPQPATQAAPTGPVAALPADNGTDEWERVYAAPGPIPADEVLL